MANGKLPPEIHLIRGSKGMNQGALLPDHVKDRIPFAEWLKEPNNFNKEKFIEETSNYLFEVYGIGSKQDRHSLASWPTRCKPTLMPGRSKTNIRWL